MAGLFGDYDEETRIARGLANLNMAAAQDLWGTAPARDPYTAAAPPMGGISALGAFAGLIEQAPMSVAQLLQNKFFAEPPRRRVFISFQMEDQWAVELLRGVSANPNFDFEIYDELVKVAFDSVDAEYIKYKIRQRIDRSSVTVCLVGLGTHKSDWVDFEIGESIAKRKRVIGMAVPGLDRLPYPQLFQLTGAPIKTWNLDWLRRELVAAPIATDW